MSAPTKILAVLIALLLAAPMFIVIPISFSTAASLKFPPPGYWLGFYRQFFIDPNWIGSLANSIVIGAGAAALTMLLATPAALALVRFTFRFSKSLRMLLLAPLVIPHILMALGYYSFFGQLGLLQTYTGVILAHTCLAIPVATLILTASLMGFDRRLEQAAANLGASSMVTFRLVTFPIMRPAFLIAALFAFISSFDETVVAIFISGRDRSTLTRQMYNSFSIEADPVISVASSLILVSVVTVVAVVMTVRWTRNLPPTQPI